MIYIFKAIEYIKAIAAEIAIRLMIVFQRRLTSSDYRDHKIIATVTSYPRRMRKLPAMLASLLRQKVKPDKIVVYLSEEECKGYKFPYIYKLLQKKGVEISYCKENYRSHKKYYYALKEYPDDIVITFDDDIIYSSDVIKILYDSYKRNPNCVTACKVLRMEIDESGRPKGYDEWKPANNGKASYRNYAVGVGGVLYPPHCLCEEAFNVEKMLKLAPTQDDLWLKVNELLSNTPVVLAGDTSLTRGIVIRGTQRGLALGIENSCGRSDEQIKNTFENYNLFENKNLYNMLLKDDI